MERDRIPSNITPFLVAALICDVAVEDPGTGKKNLIGIFDHVEAAAFPTARPMSLYLKMTDGEGYYPIEIDYVFVNTGELLGQVAGEIEIRDRTDSVDLCISLPPAPIPQPGRYEFRIKASGMFLGNTFIDVVERALSR